MNYYKTVNDFDNSIAIGKDILQEYQNDITLKEEGMYHDLLFNIGVLYAKKKQYDSSNIYLKEAIKGGGTL